MARTHNRILGMSGAGLVVNPETRRGARFQPHVDSLKSMGVVQEMLEPLMIETKYLEGAPFEWITVMLHYGLKNETEPRYQRIHKKYKDLPLTIELDMHELREMNQEQLNYRFLVTTLKCLIHVGKKYNLPTEVFEKRLSELERESSHG